MSLNHVPAYLLNHSIRAYWHLIHGDGTGTGQGRQGQEDKWEIQKDALI